MCNNLTHLLVNWFKLVISGAHHLTTTIELWIQRLTYTLSTKWDHLITKLDHFITKLNDIITKLDDTLTKLNHALTKLDHLITKLDHSLTKLDHLITKLDHLVTKLDHTLTFSQPRIFPHAISSPCSPHGPVPLKTLPSSHHLIQCFTKLYHLLTFYTTYHHLEQSLDHYFITWTSP